MSDMNKIVKSAIGVVLAVATASTVIAATANAAPASKTEKCYGIVKAGLNDCQTATQSCAGSATKNSQSDAFVFLPKGVCAKIVGGSLTSSKG